MTVLNTGRFAGSVVGHAPKRPTGCCGSGGPKRLTGHCHGVEETRSATAITGAPPAPAPTTNLQLRRQEK